MTLGLVGLNRCFELPLMVDTQRSGTGASRIRKSAFLKSACRLGAAVFSLLATIRKSMLQTALCRSRSFQRSLGFFGGFARAALGAFEIRNLFHQLLALTHR